MKKASFSEEKEASSGLMCSERHQNPSDTNHCLMYNRKAGLKCFSDSIGFTKQYICL
jgi:hypothetical protein